MTNLRSAFMILAKEIKKSREIADHISSYYGADACRIEANMARDTINDAIVFALNRLDYAFTAYVDASIDSGISIRADITKAAQKMYLKLLKTMSKIRELEAGL